MEIVSIPDYNGILKKTKQRKQIERNLKVKNNKEFQLIGRAQRHNGTDRVSKPEWRKINETQSGAIFKDH